MDWFAVISNGTYADSAATPTQIAILAASHGLLDTAPSSSGGLGKLLKIIGAAFKKLIGG